MKIDKNKEDKIDEEEEPLKKEEPSAPRIFTEAGAFDIPTSRKLAKIFGLPNEYKNRE